MHRRCVPRGAAAWMALLALALPGAARADDGYRISGPVSHDNLAIYFVHGKSAPGAVPLTLTEGLADGSVKVYETRKVNELAIENFGDREIFVQSGDIVKGGQQDRVLSVDLLLPPRSGRVPIAAFCVEQGRWSARGKEDARQFSSATTAMPSRYAKMKMRAYVASVPVASESPVAYARRGDTGAPQQEIWSDVKKTQDSLSRSVRTVAAAPASPTSLQLSLENEKLKEAQAAYIKALQGAGEKDADIVGYVFATNGKINSGEVYASNALFRKMWRKLLAANVTEAISEKDAASGAPPSLADVEAFLKVAESGSEAERRLNASVRLATRDNDTALYAETRRADGGWVHRNYLAK
jgi:hypothetical protein